MFKLPELPYALDALAPHISRETMEYHYTKHHQTYIDKLNSLTEGTEFENAPLDEVVKKSSGGVFNNGAQAWNHAFFWHCMSPDGGGEPDGALAKAVDEQFGSAGEMRKKFTETATTVFGSGWTWLVKNQDGSLDIAKSQGAADNPVSWDKGQTPLLGLDMWEHAYYIDRRNDKGAYLKAFFEVVNWDFVGQNLEGKSDILKGA